MLISSRHLSHWINNFYGYGDWSAPVWFVGFEESGGDLPEEVAEKLNYFYREHPADNSPTLCDIRKLYREVVFRTDGPRAERYKNFFDYRFGEHAVLHGLWKNLIVFEHGLRDKPIPDLASYQRRNFLSTEKPMEALIELYPLPAHNHAWYYSWLDLPDLPFLKTRSQYEQHVFQDRMTTILNNISQRQPEVVLMFGMKDINSIKEMIQQKFPSTRFTLVRTIKHQIPQHHRADLGATTLLLTTQIPALKHNRKETGFDWEAVAKSIKG